MDFYVYIIKSLKDDSFYKGFTTDPLKRLYQHNNGETYSTRNLAPWILVYVEKMASKTDAIIREKNIKKATRERIIALISHDKNIVQQFIGNDQTT